MILFDFILFYFTFSLPCGPIPPPTTHIFASPTSKLSLPLPQEKKKKKRKEKKKTTICITQKASFSHTTLPRTGIANPVIDDTLLLVVSQISTMGNGKKARPACAEDYDEEAGIPVPQTKITARTRAIEKPKPRVRNGNGNERRESKSKPSKQNSDSGYSTGAVITGSEASLSPPQQKVEFVTAVATTERREPRKPTRSSSRPPRSPSAQGHRPLADRTRDMPAHYGVPNAPAPAAVRPPPVVSQPIQPVQPIPRRATGPSYARPMSFTATHGPPLSNSAYYNSPPAYPPPPPPQSSYTFNNYAPSSQANGYFPAPAPSRPLSARFDIGQRVDIPRSGSAFGIRESPRALPAPPPQRTIANGSEAGYSYYDESLDGYTSDAASIRRPASRTASIRIASRGGKEDREYHEMPPPPRPIMRRPVTDTPRSYTPDSLASSVYRSEGQSFRGPVYVEPAQSFPRPGMKRHSVSYDLGDLRIPRDPPERERVRVETANNSRRRQSVYDQSTSGASSEYEEKVREASKYQENVAGHSVPLTAEALKRQRATGSNRSTKSSGSRDESDYRKSVTTPTTRSSSNEDDENITIKVTGSAKVHVGGTRIECGEGGEIEIKRRENIRGGSDRSSSEYGGGRFIDDRRSRADRIEQLSQRPRRDSVSRPAYGRISPRDEESWV